MDEAGINNLIRACTVKPNRSEPGYSNNTGTVLKMVQNHIKNQLLNSNLLITKLDRYSKITVILKYFFRTLNLKKENASAIAKL